MSFPDHNSPSNGTDGTLIYVYNKESFKSSANTPIDSGASEVHKTAFSCDSCQQSFPNKRQLKHHQMTHQLTKSYNCKDCSSSFNNLDNLLLHMAIHKIPPVRCPKCKVLFHRLSSLRGHIKTHFKSEYSICQKCREIFSQERTFRKHLQKCQGRDKVVNDKSFICPVCSKTFTRKSVLVRHKLIHSGVKPFKCSDCGQSFTQKNSLEIHKLTHTNTRPHQCPECPLNFVQKVNLQCHLRRVHCPDDPKRFPCSKCSCSFKKLSALSLHVKRTHQEVEEEHQEVEEAREKYVQFTEYRQDGSTVQHAVKEISGDKGKFLECNFCPRKQRNLSSWLHHRRHHIKSADKEAPEAPQEPEEEILAEKRTERVYQCSRCPENFLLKTQFLLHLRRHNKEMTLERRLRGLSEVARPHGCTLCPMRFTKNCHLKEHLKRHENVRPFQCATCGKTFASRASLDVHGRSHSGQKPFRCAKCDRMFSTASACRRHAEVHSLEKKHECGRCGKRFKTLESFRKHILIHDGAIVELPRAQEESENLMEGMEVLEETPEVLVQPPEGLSVVDFPGIEEDQVRNYIVILDDQQFDPAEGFLPPQLSPTNLIKINPIEGDGEATTIFSWTPQKRQKMPEECDLPPLESISDAPQQSRGEKNVKKCPNCPKTFLKPIDLRRHIRTHTGERPFSCDCGKTFSLESILKKHRLTHKTIKPKFTCLTCLKDFSSKDNLKMHQTVHTGEKPFECLYCDKHFRTMSNRNVHHSTHLKRINSTIQAEANKSSSSSSSSLEVLPPDDLPPLVPIRSIHGKPRQKPGNPSQLYQKDCNVII